MHILIRMPEPRITRADYCDHFVLPWLLKVQSHAMLSCSGTDWPGLPPVCRYPDPCKAWQLDALGELCGLLEQDEQEKNIPVFRARLEDQFRDVQRRLDALKNLQPLAARYALPQCSHAHVDAQA